MCHTLKVPVAGKHRQAVADAQLPQERVDRTNLNAAATAGVTQRRGFDVVRSIRDEEGKRGEPIQNLVLQQLLQGFSGPKAREQAGRQDRFAVLNRLNQSRGLWSRRWTIASQRKGPDNGIDEETQLRERSVLWS
jgi:hypothetical protein